MNPAVYAPHLAGTRIEDVHGRQILDSRGYPTLEVGVRLSSGARGHAAVPAGASTGRYEAQELRDGGEAWGGRGVQLAIDRVREEIAPLLAGADARDQEAIDAALVELDGTSSLVRLGGNTILGVSLAVAHAAAAEAEKPLWRHLGGPDAVLLPTPLLTAIEGGLHSDNRLVVQELLLVPVGAATFSQALRIGAEVYHALGRFLLAQGASRALGDGGGYAARLDSDEAALDAALAAIGIAGYRPGVDVALALDAAASELYSDGGYRLAGDDTPLTGEELIDHWCRLCDRYPIVSLEDPLGEADWEGWRQITARLGSHVQLVGDDLFATHASLVRLGVDQGLATAVLIKPNQVGTLTRVRETVALAHAEGYATVMAHRAGDTEDATIADLAVALGCRFIKAGGPARSERVAKYNRLLAIEEQLGGAARFGA
ncbi:MAG TPA: phosphopyruvate hydratase [Solirubrobacter sp.]|nr:phosphopyruvate hydratase [Solirubrobacter sp.]